MEGAASSVDVITVPKEMERNKEEEPFIGKVDPENIENIKKKTYKNLIAVSVGFLFIFTAFQALQNLQSSIHNDPNLGLASLSVIYVFLVLSSMFVPTILIGKLGAKYTIMLAMCGYVLYTLANFYPRWWTLIITSAILGFCGAPLWAAKCAYLTTSGMIYGKSVGKSKDGIISSFFGIFFLIFQSGQIWGNLISSQVLKPSGGVYNSSGEDVSKICGARYCPLTTNMSLVHQETTSHTIITLMSIYLVFGVLAIAVVFFFLDQIDIIGDNKVKGPCDLCIATFQHLKKRKMQLLVPLTLFSGLEQGFVFGDFTKVYVTCTIGIEKVGLIMICFGVVDAFFSFVLGKIPGRPIKMASAAVINLGLLIFFLLWQPSASSVYMFYITAALWGFSDAVWQTQVNAFYGVLFSTNQEAAFSNYRLWESLGFVISFACGNYLCTDVKLYILIGLLIVGITLYGFIEYIQKHEKTENNEIIEMNSD